jgi:micrococcal nuclease
MAIRLNGLAAPEGAEPGGAEASEAMRALVLGKVVTCELDGDRKHDRCIAVCALEGADIAAELVQLGLARDCPRYSAGRYQGVELEAAAHGRPRSGRRIGCRATAGRGDRNAATPPGRAGMSQ